MDLTTLFEMDWYDRSSLTSVLKANRGRWIHFTRGAPNRDVYSAKLLQKPEGAPPGYNRKAVKKHNQQVNRIDRMNAMTPVPKLGINPRSMWNDPKGVYFYPVNWMLSGSERTLNGNQFGTDFPYYYIADLNLDDPDGVNLGTVTWEQVASIAKRNGWDDAFQAYQAASPEEKKKMLRDEADAPGKFLWNFVKRLVSDNKISWTKAFKGISYLNDPGLGIIHNYEPAQILVLKPSIIRNATLGQNATPMKFNDQDKIDYWMPTLVRLMKAVRGEFGGELSWKHKVPTLNFTAGQGRFVLTVKNDRGYMTPELRFDYSWGKASYSMAIKLETLRDQSFEQIVKQITDKVMAVSRAKSDLLFKPVIPIAEAKRKLTTEVTHLPDMPVNVEIQNDVGNPQHDRKWDRVYLRGEITREIDGIAVQTQALGSLSSTVFSASLRLRVGKTDLIYTSASEGDPAELAEEAAKSFETAIRYYSPEQRSSTYRRNPVFDDTTFEAAKGWIILNSGIALDGLLEQRYAEQIAAFQAMSPRAQKAVIDEIRYCMNSRY